MALLRQGLRPRDIVDRRSLENAAAIVAATGGSTNAALHLPALAHDIGGVPVVMRALLDGGFLHGDCLTVTGHTAAENLEETHLPTDQDVVYPATSPLSTTGGLVGLSGNLAPDGAIVKVAGLHIREFTGPARCFDREEVALITDGRFSGATRGLCVGHVGPEAALGGPIALIEDGDLIEIDTIVGTLTLHVEQQTLDSRFARWKPRDHGNGSGALWRYSHTVGSARYGAVTHPGAAAESVAFADL